MKLNFAWDTDVPVRMKGLREYNLKNLIFVYFFKFQKKKYKMCVILFTWRRLSRMIIKKQNKTKKNKTKKQNQKTPKQTNSRSRKKSNASIPWERKTSFVRWRPLFHSKAYLFCWLFWSKDFILNDASLDLKCLKYERIKRKL